VPNYQDLVDVAQAAAEEAAAFIRSVDRPRDPGSWSAKGLNDFVTHVDETAEALIAEHLTRAFPKSTVLGEELSPEAHSSELLWVVDPLDGTTNYLHGYPAYAVSIAATTAGAPLAGVVVDVDGRTTYTATEGGGAWCDGEQLSVSPNADPAAALVGTGFPFKRLETLPRYLRQFTRILSSTSGVRRAGAAALDLVDVARGRFDGFWELSLAPWDVAAGTLLVRESGGLVTTIDGSHDVIAHGTIVAGNPALHAWLLETLRECDGAD
jgi:myo-inositol-1(or 4)-monophosphatase